jgi:hypothetical protein
MKLLVGTLIVAASGVAAYGQAAAPAHAPLPSVRSTAPVEAKVIAELAAAYNQVGGVKNSPFTADEVNESIQILADGNRIVHNSTSKIYRNSEGRMRRDMKGGAMGGVMGNTYTFSGGVSLLDPARAQQVMLDTETKVARVAELRAAQEALTVVQKMELSDTDRARAEVNKAQAVEILRGEQAKPTRAAVAPTTTPRVISGQGGLVTGTGGTWTVAPTSKYETRTEELGVRDFDGVSAEGRRTITTIPAGAIGNERPIETVYERWYSKELGMVVFSRRSDPRTGEQVYELRNIIRSEPDPSLFEIPTTYRKISEVPVVRSGVTAAGKGGTMAPAKSTTKPVYVKNQPQT